MRRFIVLIGSLFSLPLMATADYSPRDFLAAAPADTFYTEDEISEDEKRQLLHTHVDPQRTFTCEAWGIAHESPTSLTLQTCPDSFVRIQLYREASGGPIVAVESNRSSGRSVDLQFFKVSETNRAPSKINDDGLKALGLTDVTENDLLDEKDAFPPGEAERVHLSMDESGRLQATVRSWNDPRWERKTVAFDLTFEWNGSRFHRSRVRLPSILRHL
ncbi:MAG: hypothetical protein RIS36_1450 [Pseudomonadota bacterium]|jgi:hypothetical protein